MSDTYALSCSRIRAAELGPASVGIKEFNQIWGGIQLQQIFAKELKGIRWMGTKSVVYTG